MAAIGEPAREQPLQVPAPITTEPVKEPSPSVTPAVQPETVPA